MRTTKQSKLKFLLLLMFGLLVSCSSPPDIPGCTAFPSPNYFKMKNLFLKLCGDDPACKPNLAMWSAQFDNWTVPSDSAMCVLLVSGKQIYVDKDNPYIDGSTWPQLALKSVFLPAKQSVAPLETYIENQCHQSQKCGSNIGDWQSTTKAINEQIK